jgi:hypothetical protein
LKNNSDGIDDILSAVEMHTTVLQNSSVQNLQTTSVQNFQNKSFPIQFPMISNCSNFTKFCVPSVVFPLYVWREFSALCPVTVNICLLGICAASNKWTVVARHEWLVHIVDKPA